VRNFNFGSACDVIDPELIRNIRLDVLEAIERYVQTGGYLGDFLTAVVENNLREALGRADDDNLRAIHDIVRVFYNYCPGNCWGSRENRKNWQMRGGLAGFAADRGDETIAEAAR